MSSLEKVVKFLQKHNSGFDHVLNKVKVTSAGDGKCVAEFKVEKENSNPMGSLHGGFSMTIIDTMTAMALRTLLDDTVHVSVDIHLTFLKKANIGDHIVVEAKTVKCGKSLAFLETILTNKSTGDLLVKASQTKFIVSDQKVN